MWWFQHAWGHCSAKTTAGGGGACLLLFIDRSVQYGTFLVSYQKEDSYVSTSFWLTFFFTLTSAGVDFAKQTSPHTSVYFDLTERTQRCNIYSSHQKGKSFCLSETWILLFYKICRCLKHVFHRWTPCNNKLVGLSLISSLFPSLGKMNARNSKETLSATWRMNISTDF